MSAKISLLCASLLLLVGCASGFPDIQTLCLRDEVGNYVIKWEVEPVWKGRVVMAVSDDPEHFGLPEMRADIRDGWQRISRTTT